MTFYEVGAFAGEAGVDLIGRLEDAGVEINGTGFMHYEPLDDGQVIPTIAAPIADEGYPGDSVVEVATLESVHVVSATYHGSEGHDAVGPLYGQLARYADDHGYDVLGPGRDHIIEFTDDGTLLLELQLSRRRPHVVRAGRSGWCGRPGR